MIKILHNKYWGVDLTLTQYSNLSFNIKCFGLYDTTIEFDFDDLYDEFLEIYIDSENKNINIDSINEIDSFFKTAYDNFIWLRSNTSSIYELLSEESYFQSDDYDGNSITLSDLSIKTKHIISAIMIDKIIFYPEGKFSIEYSINKESFYITFDSNQEVDYD